MSIAFVRGKRGRDDPPAPDVPQKEARGNCQRCGEPFGDATAGVTCAECLIAGCTRPGCTPRCGPCTQPICAGCQPNHQPQANDAAGHAICRQTASSCPACGQWRCTAACGGAHWNTTDVSNHACCGANATQCPVCHDWFCNAHCAAAHWHENDALNHPCCPKAAVKCNHCKKPFCADCRETHRGETDTAGHATCQDSIVTCKRCAETLCTACKDVHLTRASCGHGACKNQPSKCFGCDKTCCLDCASALIIDVCPVCAGKEVVEDTSVASFTFNRKLVPGSEGKGWRQTFALGPISSGSASGRGSPDPALAALPQTAFTEDLKQFDRGHLFAIELNGKDDSKLIVPMNRQFNESGKWRTMETAIKDMINAGKIVQRGTQDASRAALALRSKATINRYWHMKVWLFYEETKGDWRIPVHSYVRVYCRLYLQAHYSLSNICSKKKTIPSEAEMIEFEAAKELFRRVMEKEASGMVLSYEYRDIYKSPWNARDLPNQLLQFMHDVNNCCKSLKMADKDYVFQTFDVVGMDERTGYKPFQRAILRKFNRWRNGPVLALGGITCGELKSDVQTDNQYPGEKKDIWKILNECGGRSAPEVDHIVPSFQRGYNSYINGRLVSFQHNHLYREKQTTGAIEVNKQMETMNIGFLDEASPAGGVAGWFASREGKTKAEYYREYFADDKLFNKDLNLLNSKVRNNKAPYDDWNWRLVQFRQTFKKADRARMAEKEEELARGAQYKKSWDSHDAGVSTFHLNPDHAERRRLKDLIDEGNRDVALADLSDKFKDDGKGLVTTADEEMKKVYIDGRDKAEYDAVFTRFNNLLTKLT